MSAISQQSYINPNTPLFSLAGSGGGGGSFALPSTISAATLYVSSISNHFDYLGISTTTFNAINFQQSAPVGSQMPRLQMKIRQDAADAGAIQSLELGTDFKRAVSYINSVWDSYILMPLEMNIQSLTVQDETGLCMTVDNQVTQVPQLSTINVNTATINNVPVTPPFYLSTSSNYNYSFAFNPGQNVVLLTYDMPSNIPAGQYEYTAPISFNTSNAAGVTSLILSVTAGIGSFYDYNTTCLFNQKTNEFVYYTLRGTLQTNGLNPGVSICGTCVDSFDIDVSALGAVAQTCILKKIG